MDDYDYAPNDLCPQCGEPLEREADPTGETCTTIAFCPICGWPESDAERKV